MFKFKIAQTILGNTLFNYISTGPKNLVEYPIEFVRDEVTGKVNKIIYGLGTEQWSDETISNVVMQWEANSPVDMDLYGIVGDKHVWYSTKTVGDLHLNFDYTQHLDNQSSEIMSVAGYKDETLKVYKKILVVAIVEIATTKFFYRVIN